MSIKTLKDIQVFPVIANYPGKKRNRSSKQKSKEKEEIEDLSTPQIVEMAVSDFQEQENEPKYCFCNGISYGDMIKCDNDKVYYINI